jgi:hypothetical protein
MKIVDNAIAASVERGGKIVYLTSIPGLHKALLERSRSCHEAADATTEYWGEDAEGNEWRIHVWRLL